MEALHEHQLAAVETALKAMETGKKSGLWSIVDRAGADRACLELARRLGCRTLILVSQQSDLERTQTEASKLWPADQIGIVQGRNDERRDRDLVIGCVNSLSSRRLTQIPSDQYGLVVVADCHHVPGKRWRRVLDHFLPEFLLGITATPDRLDGLGLEPWFGAKPIFSYSLTAAISDGVLVAPRQVAFHPTAGTSRTAASREDRDSRRARPSISRDELDRKVVELYVSTAHGRKAVVFAENKAHVKAAVARFRVAGIPSGSIIAGMSKAERDRVLEEFASGRIQVLVNCRICAHGFSDPEIEILAIARQTQSRGLFQDFILVGLEPCSRIWKQECLVLDLAGNSERHSLLAPHTLVGTGLTAPSSPTKKGVAMYGSALHPAPQAVPQVSVEQPTTAVGWEVRHVSPWTAPGDLGNGDQRWRKRPMTAKQEAFIRRLGAQVPYPLTRGEASDLIDRLLNCR